MPATLGGRPLLPALAQCGRAARVPAHALTPRVACTPAAPLSGALAHSWASAEHRLCRYVLEDEGQMLRYWCPRKLPSFWQVRPLFCARGLPDAARPFVRYLTTTVPYAPPHERRLSTAHAVPHRPPRPRRHTYGSARSAWQSVRCSVRCCRIGRRRTLLMSCRRGTPARAVACLRACVPVCAFVRACVRGSF